MKERTHKEYSGNGKQSLWTGKTILEHSEQPDSWIRTTFEAASMLRLNNNYICNYNYH